MTINRKLCALAAFLLLVACSKNDGNFEIKCHGSSINIVNESIQSTENIEQNYKFSTFGLPGYACEVRGKVLFCSNVTDEANTRNRSQIVYDDATNAITETHITRTLDQKDIHSPNIKIKKIFIGRCKTSLLSRP